MELGFKGKCPVDQVCSVQIFEIWQHEGDCRFNQLLAFCAGKTPGLMDSMPGKQTPLRLGVSRLETGIAHLSLALLPAPSATWIWIHVQVEVEFGEILECEGEQEAKIGNAIAIVTRHQTKGGNPAAQVL